MSLEDYTKADLLYSLFPKAHSETIKKGSTSIENPSSTICGAEEILKEEGELSLEFGTLCDSIGTSDSESIKKGSLEMRWGFVNTAINPFSDIPVPPSIIGLTAADPRGKDGYTPEDTITINFNKPTNRPDASDKSDIENLLEFRDHSTKDKISIGKDFVGSWISSSKLKITILDTKNADSAALTKQPPDFFVTVKKEGNLRDNTGKSPPSTASSSSAQGSFGAKALLSVAGLVANDPQNTDPSYSNGDTISVVFSDVTNTPDVSSTSKINKLFEFIQGGESFSSIGNELQGKWTDAGITLEITVKDKSGADEIPQVDQFKVKLNDDTSLESEDGIPVDSVSESPFLQGSFGQQQGPQIVSFVASDPAGDSPQSYGSGDVLAIKFDKPTNQPQVDTKSKVNDLLRFFQDNQNVTLGDEFTARWLDPLRLEIKIKEATIDGADPSPLPQTGKLRVEIKEQGGLQNPDETSKNSKSTSPALSGTFEAQDGPRILRVSAADPDGGPEGYSDGDTITIRFSEATNMLAVSSKSQIAKFLEFKDAADNGNDVELGTKYSGEWTTPDTLLITIQNSDGAIDPFPADGEGTDKRLHVDPKKFTENGVDKGIQNSEETSKFTKAISQPITGQFGNREGPLIDALVADDPDDSDSIFSSDDTITVRFAESTNKADPTPSQEGLSKSDLQEMFAFSQSLGPEFSGEWTNARTLVITVQTPTPLSPPEPGQFRVVALESGNILDDEEKSQPSSDKSPPLLGNFGTYNREKAVESGATATAELPAGTISQTTLPSGERGTVTISRTQASNVLERGDKEAEFVGDVSDIDAIDGASCSNTCTMSFLFSDDDAEQAEVDPFDVKIMHDKNDDGDFDDQGEIIEDTTVVQFSPGIFKASANAEKTSKFAVGGVRSVETDTSSGGGGGFDSIPPRITSEEIESPGGRIFGARLDLTEDQPVATNTFETGEVVNVAVSLSENLGLLNLQHVALYTNIRGDFKNDPSHSDAWVVWEKGEPVKVNDKNGFWTVSAESLREGQTALKNTNVTISASNLGKVQLSSASEEVLTSQDIQDKKSGSVKDIQVVFSVVFQKPMKTSDIVIRAWDDNRNFEEQRYTDVWSIIETSGEKQQQTLQEDTEKKEDKKAKEVTKKEINIPAWIKNNAGWWSKEQISDSEFARAIEYLMENDIVDVPVDTSSGSDKAEQDVQSSSKTGIPSWVRNVAGWWSEDQVSDEEFVRSVEYLAQKGVIKVK